MPIVLLLAMFLVISAFAKDWAHYSGQNEVRYETRADNGTLWVAFAWGLLEQLPNKTENIYMPGNNNLQAADFVQVFALPDGDIIAVSKKGILVRKNKNSKNFETINSSSVEKNRDMLNGLGERAENILVLPFEGAIAFFDYEQNLFVMTLSQLGTNSLDEYQIKRVVVEGDSIWVDLNVAIWKREIVWSKIREDRYLADPNSWLKADMLSLPEKTKPSYDASGLNHYMKNVQTLSLVSGGKMLAWGDNYVNFSVMQNENWSEIFKANQNPHNYGYDQQWYDPKSLTMLPNGKFAFGMWGSGLTTYDENFRVSGWFHSSVSNDACPSKYTKNDNGSYTIVQGTAPSPDFSGFIFSYLNDNPNYGLGFVNSNGKAECIEDEKSLSPVAFSIIARENEAGEWRIYAAWKSNLSSKDGGVDFYLSPQNKFSPVLQKKWTLSFGSPIDFAFDSEGTLWAVSQSKIFYLDESEDEWKEPSYIRGFNGGTISSLETDAQNGLWIGVRGEGAYSFSQINKSPDSLAAKNFKVKDGLLSENVYDIAIDTIKGKVYFAHDLGLSVYSTALVRGASDYMQDGAPKVKAYPNPFRPNLHGSVKIDFISEKSSVYILDSSGKRVRLFKGDDLRGGMVVWDGRNESGKLVAPGLYHYIAADGKNTAKGKIIIER